MSAPATTATRARPRLTLLLVLLTAALAGVLVGLALTATTAVPGIVEPSEAVVVGLPLSRAVLDLAALTTVGMSFLPRLVGFDRPGLAEPTLAVARRIAVLSSAVWFVAALTSLVLETADTNPGAPVTVAGIEAYVRHIASGQGLLIVACCALLYLVIAVLAARRGEVVPAELRITVAMFALLPLPATGHAAHDMGSLHDVSMVSMELHVLGAVTWTGGLLATMLLVTTNRRLLAEVLPRFSKLATLCVFLTGITGLLNGWLELYLTPGVHWYVALVTTGYGWIVLGKAVCVLGAGLLGGYTRLRLLPGILARRATAVATWTTVELAVLGLAFGLASVLVRSPVIGGG